MFENHNVDKLSQTNLKVWLCEASSHGNHGGGERAGDPDGGQELGDVRRQAERDGPVGVQVACGVVDVEAEVGDVQLAGVLEAEGVKYKLQVLQTSVYRCICKKEDVLNKALKRSRNIAFST